MFCSCSNPHDEEEELFGGVGPREIEGEAGPLHEARQRLLEALCHGDRYEVAVALENVPAELRADRDIILKAVESRGAVLEFAAEKLKADRDVVLKAVESNGAALQYAAEELRADRDVVLKAVERYGPALAYAAEKLRADRDVVLKAVETDGNALGYAEELWADRDVVLKAVESDGRALMHATKELQADRDVVLHAVESRGDALRFAAKELKAERDFVLKAVESNGVALQYAAEELRADRDVVLKAVESKGVALQYAAAEKLTADRDVVLKAVESNGEALKYAAKELTADRDVVLKAVESYGDALMHAAEELWADRDVVLKAAESRGDALRFAAKELKAERDFILKAVESNGPTLEYAAEELTADRDFLLALVRATRADWLLQFASKELQKDEALARRCKEAAGTGLVFTYYRSYACFQDMRDRFLAAGASVPGGEAYEAVMVELKKSHGSTATVWFDQQLVFGHAADDGRWTHPSHDCGRDMAPVPPEAGREAKWNSTVDSRSQSLVPKVGKSYVCWCCHWLREVRRHHERGEVICAAVSNIFAEEWVQKYGAGSSELSDADAELHGLPRETFKNGRPPGWGEGRIRISNGKSFERKAPVHPKTEKPLGVGCRWERQALDNMEFPVYAFFIP